MTHDRRRVPWRNGWFAALAVLAMLVLGVQALLRWTPAAPTPGPTVVEPSPAAPAVVVPRPESTPAPLQQDPGSQPAAEVVEEREAIEEPPPLEGIYVFPPLGTRQLLSGIIVPEDFELPPGFVRHFQSTDDGVPLPPILMFHPRRPPLDASGNPVPVTPDRVVPPELAPEGMPIVILDAPRSGPPPDGLSRFRDGR